MHPLLRGLRESLVGPNLPGEDDLLARHGRSRRANDMKTRFQVPDELKSGCRAFNKSGG